MGLCISLGYLADLAKHDPEGFEWEKENLEKINSVLEENNLAIYNEPEPEVEFQYRAVLRNLLYSWIHYLSRFTALVLYDNSVVSPSPLVDGEDPNDDPILEDAYFLHMDSHLIVILTQKGIMCLLNSLTLYTRIREMQFLAVFLARVIDYSKNQFLLR